MQSASMVDGRTAVMNSHPLFNAMKIKLFALFFYEEQ
jgi:hypothetical protein